MARLRSIEPSEAEGRAKELFSGPLKSMQINIFKGMVNSPAAVEAYLGMAGALAKASLSAAEREMIALAISEANQCAYCLAAHTAIGKGAGLSDASVLESRRGHLPADARADAIVKFALKVHEKRGFVSDGDLADFRSAGFGDGHIAEVVAVYAQTVFTNVFNHVNQTAVDFPAAPAIR